MIVISVLSRSIAGAAIAPPTSLMEQDKVQAEEKGMETERYDGYIELTLVIRLAKLQN